MTTMTVGMISFDTTDAASLAAWWAKHTGGTAEDQSGGGGWFVTVDAPGMPTLGFQKVADPTPGKNRLHLDLGSSDPAAMIAALTADGATLVAEHTIPGGDFSWTVMADPDGNQFCVGAPHEG